MEPKSDPSATLPISTNTNNSESIHRKLKIDVKHLIKEAESKPINYSQFKDVLSTFKRHFDTANDGGSYDQRKTSEMLRESGVFAVLVGVLEEALIAGKTTTVRKSDVDLKLFSTALNILANFFVFDVSETTKGASWELKVLDMAQQILLHSILSSDSDILHRTLRLITNVLKKCNCYLHSIIRAGLLDGILGVISKVRKLKGTNVVPNSQKILTAFFRCLRICVSDKNVKIRINSMDGITFVTAPLFWDHRPLDDTCKLDMFRIVNDLLDDKMSAMTREQVDKLNHEGLHILQTIIKLFRNSIPNSEIHAVSQQILRNLISSKMIMTALTDAGIYEAIFHHISESEGSILESKLQLLGQLLLTGNNVFVPTIVDAPNLKSIIASSLKVLRMKELFHHHVMIWWIYQNLVSDSLTALIEAGLMTEVIKSLQNSSGVTSFDELRRHFHRAFLAEASSSPDETPEPPRYYPSNRSTVIQRPPQDYAVESPVTSPGQSSPTSSSGIYSMNEESDEGSYSPLASDEDTTFLSVDIGLNRDQLLSNDDASSDEGLPRKRMKRDLSPVAEVVEVKLKPVLNTVYEVSLVGNILNLVKKLLFIPSLRQELSSLLPSFIGLFLEVGWRPGSDFRLPTENFCSTFIVHCNTSHLQSSLNVILQNLFQDNKLFQGYVRQEVPTLLYKMGFSKPGTMNASIDRLLTALRGKEYSAIRESRLGQCLTADTDQLQKVKAAICLPILFNYTTPHFWFKRCSEVLIESLEEGSNIPRPLFDPESAALSLLAMSDNLDMNWTLLQQQMRAAQVPLIPLSEFRLPNCPTSTTVVISCGGIAVLHIETEFLNETSPVFQVMLEGSFREAKERRINLTEFSGHGVRLFFEQVQALKEHRSRPERGIPGGKLNSVHTLFEILSLAHRYMIPDLYNKIANRILGTELDESIFMIVYKTADRFPEFPFDVTKSDSLSIRVMTLLYLLVTKEMSIPTKIGLFKELLQDTMRKSTFLMDLKTIYSVVGQRKLMR